MREGGCWPKRPIAVLTVRMSTPKSLQFSVFFSSGGGRGNFFVRGREGGCWPKRPKAPCVYRIPPGPHVLCGHSREFCEKRGFRKSPLRGGGRPGRQHSPPTPPASPVEPERGRGGIARNFETPQITERLGQGSIRLSPIRVKEGEGFGAGETKGLETLLVPPPR